MADPSPSAATLRASFDAAADYTVGIEEEVMLLDPATLELTPRALEILAGFDGDPRFKPELPASQIEILVGPQASVREAVVELEASRHELAARTEGEVRLAAAGVSPIGSGSGELNSLPRYQDIEQEYGPIARRQLVCALQVHVSLGDAERALAVYNAARSYLPFLAALAANGAFYEGRDSGLASVRPKLSQLLPRQGIPPVFSTWEEYADALSWGAETGAFPDLSAWWWELRPHPRFGTLEFRVPDSQSTIGEAAAIAATIQALVVWLAERHEAGESLARASTWRIEENRWSACRHGVEGWAIDPEAGVRRTMRACLDDLLDRLAPIAARVGSATYLKRAGQMVTANGAIEQRRIGDAEGAAGVARWLAGRFLAPWPG